MAKIAVMGYGTIGSGVVEAISMNQKSIQIKAGEEISVKYVLDLRDFPGDPIQDRIIHDYQTIVQDPEISVVVETMGGVEPACTFAMAMLKAGKSVVTSNKALVAEYGAELMETAVENHCNFFFEASVGGGIPIIRPLYKCLTPDVVTEITGILNGTTNYILTEMSQKGVSFEEALKEAQALGYAERDPSADVEGGDACRKIAILSSVAMGKKVVFTDIHMEGITDVMTEDFQYAQEMGMSIKLLASSRMSDDHSHMQSMVAPFMISREHPLYGVQDVFNAVMVTGNVVDQLMFFGRGAGKLPTAAAVVADVIEAVKLKDVCETLPWDREVLKPDDYRQYTARFMVRLPENMESALYEELFRPEKVLTGVVPGELAVITAPMTEMQYMEAEEKCGRVISRTRLY
ncbi:MAG: homoserine dehydrogenase [Lachnospiraceae bacterium]|nr:homoserine dehydrogenase [Lachnospiraceae bacterium]